MLRYDEELRRNAGFGEVNVYFEDCIAFFIRSSILPLLSYSL